MPLFQFLQIVTVIASAYLIYLGWRDKRITDRALATGMATEQTKIVRGWQKTLGKFWWVPKMTIHVAASTAFVAIAFLLPQIAWIPAILSIGSAVFYYDLLKDNEAVVEAIEGSDEWRSRSG